jgi:hypothetical protein
LISIWLMRCTIANTTTDVKLIHALGAKSAILVAQLFYWKGKEQAEDGWIYKTKEELERETGLSRHEQNTCVEDLKKKGALETRYDRLEHRLYYRIGKEALDSIMESDFPSQIRNSDFGKSESFPAEIRKPYFGKSGNRIPRKPTSGHGEIRQAEFVINQRLLSENTTEKTMTTAMDVPSNSNGNGSHHPVVVALSSVASEEDSPREIGDKLTEEFGLSIPQGRKVEMHLASKGVGYVIEKAEIVRAKKSVKNLAGAFMKALSDDWKAPRSIEPSKRQKPPQPAPEPVEELSDELLAIRRKELASLKAKLKG